MNNQLFQVESIYDNASDAEKLAALVQAGVQMRVAQNAYFSARDSATEFLRLAKAKEAHFDRLLKEFVVS